MKGEALITIKTKDGKIKQQVKEKNIVFDIPKELMKGYVENADLGTYNAASPTGEILNFDLWFKTIYVNEELSDQTTPRNWKMPVLFGGDTTNNDSANKRYAVADSVNSIMTSNIIKRYFTWNDCPAFTLRSINLRHKDYSGSSIVQTSRGHRIVKYGKFYWLSSMPAEGNTFDSNKPGLKFNQLGEKSTFNWKSNYSGRLFTGLQVAGGWSSGSPWIWRSAITALKKNGNVKEIALLRQTNDITTDATSGQSTFNYLHIINADTGELVRSFAATQFTGLYSTGRTFYSVKIIPTEYGNFLLGMKTGGAAMSLWLIPDTPTSESIPMWADGIAQMTQTIENGTIIISNLIFKFASSSSGGRKTIKINSATPGDITTYDYVPFNVGASYDGYGFGLSSDQKDEYIDSEFSYDAASVDRWFSVTALNLSEGIAVAAGDTLTIEYTITAN